MPLPVTIPEAALPGLREAYYEAGAQIAHAAGGGCDSCSVHPCARPEERRQAARLEGRSEALTAPRTPFETPAGGAPQDEVIPKT